MSFKALFYIEQNYAYAILRPLQTEIVTNGGSVYWFLAGDEVDANFLDTSESRLPDVHSAVSLNASAVFAASDHVPSFIPGLKVQVFHGLNEDKRTREYPERGLFDLYCTEGPGRGLKLQQLAEQREYFKVQDTGWIKLDSLFSHTPQIDNKANRPIVLFASTFTEKLSCAEQLFPKIKQLSELGNWQWLVTLHPKMAKETVEKYRSLVGPNLQFFGNDQVIDALHQADVMVCDNSSILQEFLLLKKPVVTFENSAPADCMLDINDPAMLQGAIEEALNTSPELQKAIDAYGESVTTYLDGKSAARVYQATKNMLDSGWQDKKPANYWRNWKMRCQLKYFKFF